MNQIALDFNATRANRDAALERVSRGVSPEWTEDAEAAVMRIAVQGEPFTSDDVWASGLERPRESRALGPVLLSLYRRGVIEPCGFVTTRQASRNGAPVRVWKVR